MTPHRPEDDPEIVGPAPPPASQTSKPARPSGLYEELITRRLEAVLYEIRGDGWRDEVAKLDPAEAPGVLARFVHDLVEPLLGSLTGKDRTARQLEIVNGLVTHLMSAVDNSPILDDDALQRIVNDALTTLRQLRCQLARPTRHRNSSDELPRLLVSFLKFSGWRPLRDDIRRFLDRRSGGLRVLTTY